MAKSIMADPTVRRIVTDSGKRAAKAKKKATTAMFVAPAIISTDLALKQKAANRAVEFFNSEEPELAKMERVFNKKFKFQIFSILLPDILYSASTVVSQSIPF